MTKNKFNELQKLHGSNLVYAESGVFNFSMSDGLMNMDSDEIDVYDEVEEEINGIKGGEWWVAMGDDIIHCISFTSLDDISEKVEKFIEEWIGNNCYE